MKKTNDNGGYNGSMVCEYGTRHPHRNGSFESCNCKEKYKVPPFIFKKLVKQKFGVEYAIDITEYMQQKLFPICVDYAKQADWNI